MQTVALIALELGVHVLHRVPYVGVFAHPVVSQLPCPGHCSHCCWCDGQLCMPLRCRRSLSCADSLACSILVLCVLQLHFLTVSRTLHSTPAIALSVLSLVPYFGACPHQHSLAAFLQLCCETVTLVEPTLQFEARVASQLAQLHSQRATWTASDSFLYCSGTPVKTVVRLWRASNVLGAEMVGDYVSKAIPQAERAAFWKCAPDLVLTAPLTPACYLSQACGRRRNGLTVTLFMLPQMALMKVRLSETGAALIVQRSWARKRHAANAIPACLLQGA